MLLGEICKFYLKSILFPLRGIILEPFSSSHSPFTYIPSSFSSLFPFVFAARVLGEPAFADTLFLFEDFLDAPEGGEGEYAEQGGDEDVADADGSDDAGDAQQEEEPPAACAPVVFGFDDDRVEESDNQERADAYEEA